MEREARRDQRDDRHDLIGGARQIAVEKADAARPACARVRSLPRPRARPRRPASSSLSSSLPPGKAIWPGMARKVSVRRIISTVSSGSRARSARGPPPRAWRDHRGWRCASGIEIVVAARKRLGCRGEQARARARWRNSASSNRKSAHASVDADLARRLHRPERSRTTTRRTTRPRRCRAPRDRRTAPATQRLEPRPHQHIGLEPAGARLVRDPQGMSGVDGHDIVGIGLESDDLIAAFPSTFMRMATNGASSTRMPHFSTGVTR